MLSNTKGYSRYSRTLGYHRGELSALGQVCPAWRRTGKCKPYSKEQEIRRTLAAAKEEEILKNATALYEMEMDLVEDLDSGEGSSELLESVTAQVGFSTDPAKKAEIIAKLAAALKQEPAYLNWSLDAAVEEKMVESRIRRCRYSHRTDVLASLKRSRSTQEREDVQLMQQQHQEQKEMLTSVKAQGDAHNEPEDEENHEKVTSCDRSVHLQSISTVSSSPSLIRSAAQHKTTSVASIMTAQEKKWEEERHRIFLNLTPLQRCVVCLLWQRHYRIEQGVICDVRLMLEKKLTDLYDRTGRVVVKGVVVAERLSNSSSNSSKRHKKRALNEGKEEVGELDNVDDPLDTYLSSAEFESFVERESKRIVTRVVFRPEFGMVDLSALPLLVAHLSSVPACGVLLACTLTYFTGKTLAPKQGAQAESRNDFEEDDRPAPTSFHHLLFPTRKPISEKEVDLGGAARADEVVEALEWALQVYLREGQLNVERKVSWGASMWSVSSTPARTAQTTSSLRQPPPPSPQSVSALFCHQRIRLHGLTLKHCKMTSADALVNALNKRNLGHFLYALDLSENRLWSLRFLLVLRAHFAERLLRLSLKNNSITRKPEYQEQVRLSLPQLTSLDGEPIRRPPLRLPKPLPSSYTRTTHEEINTQNETGGSRLSEQQRQKQQEEREAQASVLDCVGRLLYIWETRRIPHTQRESQALDESDGAARTEEEEWNEDNFPHRYLHPSAVFSVAIAPGLNFFDATTMRDARSVELDADYAGMRLSAVDVRDARVFDVAMKNSSRNLLAGRPTLQRFGRGAENCFLAYQFTLYPERMEVEHHVSDAVVAVARVTDVQMKTAEVAAAATTKSKNSKTKKSKKIPKDDEVQSSSSTAVRFGSLARSTGTTHHIVTLHGLMTWRLPSMKAGECLRACYTRVMIFTKKVLPMQNREWERLRSPPYVLMNDELFLYPAPANLSVTTAPSAIYRANTPGRLSRLVVEFGLEACRDGVALVRDVMERCTSPAAEYAALQALVLGVVGSHSSMVRNEAKDEDEDSRKTTPPASIPTDKGTLAGEDAATLQLAQAAAAQLRPLMEAFVDAAATATSSTAASHTYMIFSVLDGAIMEEETLQDLWGSNDQQRQENRIQLWASGPHVVTRALLHDVTSIANACYTFL